jgi:DNA-binding NarL/FixJ family response regulator
MIRGGVWSMLMVMHQPPDPHSPPIRVLIAARRPATRSALRQMVEGQLGVDVVGVVGDLPATVRVMGDLRPQVVFIERALLGRPGLPWLPPLATDAPETSIYVVGMGDHPRLQEQALHAGAAGYIRLDAANDAVPAVLATPVAA